MVKAPPAAQRAHQLGMFSHTMRSQPVRPSQVCRLARAAPVLGPAAAEIDTPLRSTSPKASSSLLSMRLSLLLVALAQLGDAVFLTSATAKATSETNLGDLASLDDFYALLGTNSSQWQDVSVFEDKVQLLGREERNLRMRRREKEGERADA